MKLTEISTDEIKGMMGRMTVSELHVLREGIMGQQTITATDDTLCWLAELEIFSRRKEG